MAATFLCFLLATTSASAFSSPAPTRRAGAAWLLPRQRSGLAAMALPTMALPAMPRGGDLRSSTRLRAEAEDSAADGADVEAEAAADDDDGPEFDEWKATLDSLVGAGSKLTGKPPPTVMTEGNDTLTLTVSDRSPLRSDRCWPRRARRTRRPSPAAPGRAKLTTSFCSHLNAANNSRPRRVPGRLP